MPDEENTQPTPESTQTESVPIPDENPISEPNLAPVSPQEPIPDAPTPPTDSVPAEAPSGPTEATPNPEEAVSVKDQNPVNEPFGSAQGKPSEPASEPLERPNITVEKHGNDVTITEVMEPTVHPEPATAQMAGNEPFDIVEEAKIKKRKENLERANAKRQEKKRDKINEILNLFGERQNITNDEVEKLLHVSDATATRYLDELEKEGKIKQVGKTGKHTHYEKI